MAPPSQGPLRPVVSGSGSGLPQEIVLERRLVFRLIFASLLVMQLLLVYLDIVVTYFEVYDHESIQDLCSMVIEVSMASWLSGAQTLVAGLVALLVYVRIGGASWWRRAGWGTVAAFLVYMAFDDGSFFHEAVGTAFKGAFGGPYEPLPGPFAFLHRLTRWFPSYGWQLVFVPFFALFGLFLLWFCWREIRHPVRWLIVVSLGCWAAAVGLDFAEGTRLYDRLGVVYRLNDVTIPHFSGVLEEWLEMFGTTLLLLVFLDHLLGLCADLRIRVVGSGPAPDR